MHQSLLIVLVVYVFSTSELLVKKAQASSSGDMYKMANTPYYNLLTKLPQTSKGQCEQHLLVVGRGLSDSFSVPCSSFGKTFINADKYLIYENPGHSFTLFSDTPSILVVIVNGQCTRRVYVTKKKKIIPSTTSMTETECQKVEEQVKQIKKENFYQTEEWRKESEEKKKIEDDNSNTGEDDVVLEPPESQTFQEKLESEEEIGNWNF